MKYKRKILSRRGRLAVLGLLLPCIALAEEPAALDKSTGSTDATSLEAVVVTARKRNEKTQDVPLSISTVSGAALERDGAYAIQDLAEKVPNLLISPSNPRQTGIAIRGLGKNAGNDGLETSVGVYIDGVYFSQPGQTAFDLFDLDQIEVLRGPQGTLFGKNNTAGVLNITTLKPSFTPSGKAEAIAGNYGTKELHATATGPLTETAAFRVTVYDKTRDGFFTNLNDGSKNGGFGRTGLRGQLLLLPSSDLSLRVIAEHYDSSEYGGNSVLWNPRITYTNGALGSSALTRYSALGYTPVFDPLARVNSTNNTSPTKTTQDALSLQATWNLGGFTLDSITAYRHYTFENVGDGDGTPLDIQTFGGTASHNGQFSQELRLASPAGQPIEYVAGLYFYHDNLWSDTHNQAGSLYAASKGITLANAGALNNVRADTVGNPIVDSYAAFTQANFHLNDRLTATAGLRETSEKKSALITQSASGGADPATLNASDLAQRNAWAPLGSASAAFTNTSLSWLGSLSYRINEDINTYATISKGFKSGGINVEVITGPLVVAPETALDFEAGIKSQWFSKRLDVNVNVYDSKIRNYQGTFTYNVTATSTANYIANVGDVRVRGAEIEAVLRPVKDLRLSAGAAYNDARYLNFTNAACPAELSNIRGLVCDFSGKQLPFAPHVTANAAFQYSQVLFDGLTGYVGGSSVYRSTQNLNTSLSVYGVQAAYTISNFQAGISGRRGKIGYDWSIWARNAFDKLYLTSVSASGSSGVSAGLGEPRTVGTTLRISY